MRLDIIPLVTVQGALTLLAEAETAGIATVAELRRQLQQHLDQARPTSQPRPAGRRRPDNITTCQVCGKPAVIVPLSLADCTPDATHAIQCQNRPAADQPWRDGMCGHTEYIMRGGR